MCHLTLNYNLDTHDVILTAVKTILDTYIGKFSLTFTLQLL